MGFVQTIRSLSQTGWPGTPGQDGATPQSAGRRRRSFNPAGARTPEEALAYIKLLHQAGRSGELAELLRRHPAFREAWQTLQQLSSANPEAAGPASSLPAPAPPSDSPVLPASAPVPEIARAQDYPAPACKPNGPLAAARQVYENLARYYAREKAASPRISLRV